VLFPIVAAVPIRSLVRHCRCYARACTLAQLCAQTFWPRAGGAPFSMIVCELEPKLENMLSRSVRRHSGGGSAEGRRSTGAGATPNPLSRYQETWRQRSGKVRH
jgi:hypothetical protein